VIRERNKEGGREGDLGIYKSIKNID